MNESTAAKLFDCRGSHSLFGFVFYVKQLYLLDYLTRYQLRIVPNINLIVLGIRRMI